MRRNENIFRSLGIGTKAGPRIARLAILLEGLKPWSVPYKLVGSVSPTAGHFLHRFDLRARRARTPLTRGPARPVRREMAPEELELLLQQVGTDRAQVVGCLSGRRSGVRVQFIAHGFCFARGGASPNLLIYSGGQAWNRTTDTGIFSLPKGFFAQRLTT